MSVELLFHRVPEYTSGEFADLEPSLISNICQGLLFLMNGWYPTTTQDASASHRAMAARDVTLFPPFGVTSVSHYWTFAYITPLSPRREARNPNFDDAASLIHRHERTLPRNAGAISFYKRAIVKYLHALQKPFYQIEQKIAELNPNSDLQQRAEAKEERSAAVKQLKEQLENFESLHPTCFIGLFEQMILQAVTSDTPLQEHGKPSDELPLGLHAIAGELERIQKIKDPAEKQTAIETAASHLHQGSPLCVQPLQQALQSCIKSKSFTDLKSKIFRLQ